ncbi:MAG TPA: bifunctional riboflavin kinase/FAD synthetase [Bryobacteraceae bacterium]
MNTRVFFSLEDAHGQFGPCALSIGNFDGVHIGHQALLEASRLHACTRRLTPAVLTFHPHPAVFVAPQRVPQTICTLEERLDRLALAGAEHILVLPFNQALARFSPQEFVSQILVNALGAKAIFVGENFRFGFRQSGTSKTLEELSAQYDFTTHFIEPVRYRGRTVSSSLIRRYLSEGKVALAGRMLGRCFSLAGPVIGGEGIGSKKTVPTLNRRPREGELVPRGVYVTETLDSATGRRWHSITNAGVRPTFGGSELTVETFLLDPFDGRSPEEIEVSFRHFIRTERTFPDAEALKAQILKDAARAKTYWRRASKAAGLPY